MFETGCFKIQRLRDVCTLKIYFDNTLELFFFFFLPSPTPLLHNTAWRFPFSLLFKTTNTHNFSRAKLRHHIGMSISSWKTIFYVLFGISENIHLQEVVGFLRWKLHPSQISLTTVLCTFGRVHATHSSLYRSSEVPYRSERDGNKATGEAGERKRTGREPTQPRESLLFHFFFPLYETRDSL